LTSQLHMDMETGMCIARRPRSLSPSFVFSLGREYIA